MIQAPSTTSLPVSKVRQNPNSRALNQEKVDSLAESMGGPTGLLHPIIVRAVADDWVVVAGNHRHAAAQKLGWETIDARVMTADDAHARLATIDENLVRASLTPAEEADAIAERKTIYELLHPKTKHGGRRDKGSSGQVDHLLKREKSFADATSRATGKSSRTIRRAVTRAKKLGHALPAVIGTSLDKGEELDALSMLPAAERANLVSRAKKGESVSAVALAPKRKAKVSLLQIWNSDEMTDAERMRFAESEAEFFARHPAVRQAISGDHANSQCPADVPCDLFVAWIRSSNAERQRFIRHHLLALEHGCKRAREADPHVSPTPDTVPEAADAATRTTLYADNDDGLDIPSCLDRREGKVPPYLRDEPDPRSADADQPRDAA